MKKICFLNTTPFWGGGEKTHLKFALRFQLKGYQVYFIAKQNSPLAIEAKKNGIIVKNINIGNLSFINPLKLLVIINFLKKEKIDTLLFSSSNDLKVGGISAKLANIKRIVYLRGVAATIKDNMLNRYLFRHVLHHIIASSKETKRAVLKHLNKYIPKHKVSVIYRGIDIEEYERFLEAAQTFDYRTNTEEIIIGNAGRLSYEKAQHYLIDIALKLKQNNIPFKILIAGEGSLRNELEEKINKHKLQNEVVLLGFIKEMESFMKSIDIFVFTSTTEGFGNVLIESGTASKPVLGFNMSTNPEIITNGTNGYLVEYPDIDALCERIITLSKNKDEIQRLGRNFKNIIEEKFQLDVVINEIEQCLLKI